MLYFNPISLHFSTKQCHLKSLPLPLDLLDDPIFANLLPQLLKPAPYALEYLIHLTFLRVALIQHALHFLDSRIKWLGPRDLLEHLEESLFTLSHDPFNLALLNDLELWLALEGEASGFKDVEKLLLLDMHAVQIVGVSVGVHIVGFLYSNIGTL